MTVLTGKITYYSKNAYCVITVLSDINLQIGDIKNRSKKPVFHFKLSKFLSELSLLCPLSLSSGKFHHREF